MNNENDIQFLDDKVLYYMCYHNIITLHKYIDSIKPIDFAMEKP